MKIVVDDKIPYIQGAFEPVAEVVYLPGAKTGPDVVKDADAIVTRTRTICNAALLESSGVRCIATATIGYDHIDTTYCDNKGIYWTNAPGCNSGSVEQYIASVLMVLATEHQWQLDQMTIGVVGVGNVGKKIARLCRNLGMTVLLNDPPRERKERSNEFVSLSHILQHADIITLHVPLEYQGEDATFHLANKDFFGQLSKQPLLINSCRGEVIDTEAVKNALEQGLIRDFICDCWEHEPDIDLDLLRMTRIATPHIAGYSKDGKAMGTLMSVRAISKFLGLGLNNWEPSGVELPAHPDIVIDGAGMTAQDIIAKAILHTYDIREDDAALRSNPADFEKLRGDYPVRREFPAYRVMLKNVAPEIVERLVQIGFKM